jgi:hypothetical protein
LSRTISGGAVCLVTQDSAAAIAQRANQTYDEGSDFPPLSKIDIFLKMQWLSD